MKSEKSNAIIAYRQNEIIAIKQTRTNPPDSNGVPSRGFFFDFIVVKAPTRLFVVLVFVYTV